MAVFHVLLMPIHLRPEGLSNLSICTVKNNVDATIHICGNIYIDSKVAFFNW
jgi:hypothetical protein